MFDDLRIFHCGYVHVPETAVDPKGSTSKLIKLPFMAVAAFHREHGLILVDAPYGHDGPRNLGILAGGLLGATAQRFELGWSIIPRIEQMGWRASEVNHVVMTHLHYDHTGGMKELGHAKFHVSQTEWIHAMGLGRWKGLLQGYAVKDFRALAPRVSTFPTPERYSREHAGHDLLGDGSLRAISLPGHSPGHTGYIFEMVDGRKIFFLGDAVFQTAQVTDHVGFGAMPRAISSDMNAALFTLAELQRYWEENEDILLLCSHDPVIGEQVMNGPISV